MIINNNHYKATLLFIQFFLLSTQTECARILIYLPYHTWSHYIQYEQLFESLVVKGHHHVTMYSPFPPKVNITGFNYIYHSNKKWEEFMSRFDPASIILNKPKSFLADSLLTLEYSGYTNEDMLTDPIFKKLIQQHPTSPHLKENSIPYLPKEASSSYDLVIIEALFMQEASVILGHIFKCPVILLRSTSITSDVSYAMHNPNIVAIMPEVYTSITDTMNIFKRLHNVYNSVLRIVFRTIKYKRINNLIAKYIDSSQIIPPIETLMRDISLCFISSNEVFDYPYPKVPNIIHIGGMHLLNKTVQPLPLDLKTILDDAKDGFILFSLGSILNPLKFPNQTINVFLETFSKFPKYTFIWKWNSTPLQNLPKHIIQKKWLPQRSILAHLNCKLFITHGGLSSQLETIYSGVPTISIPFFGDQFHNAAKSVYFGIGELLYINNLNTDLLEKAIHSVTTDIRYKENMMKRSNIMKDISLSPLDRALYWVDYVIQHKGAPHLTPNSKQLKWYQYYLLDIIGFFVLIIVFVFIVLIKIIKTIQTVIEIGRIPQDKMKIS